MTSPYLYSVANRDAELRRQGFWTGFLVCIFSLATFCAAAYGLSLLLEWARGWMW